MAGWTEIDSTTLSVAAASVTFSSGLSGYKFFRLTAYIVNDANAKQVYLRLNNDSGLNYSYQNVRANNTTVSGARATGQTQLLVGVNNIDANSGWSSTVLISKPAAGVKGQVVSQVGYDAPVSVGMQLIGGEWNNVADLISRIDVIASSNNFAAGTSLTLEGLSF